MMRSFVDELDSMYIDLKNIIVGVVDEVKVLSMESESDIRVNRSTGVVGYSFIESPTIAISNSNITTDRGGRVICGDILNRDNIMALSKGLSHIATGFRR